MKDVIYVPTGDKGSALYNRREKVMSELCNIGWQLDGRITLYDGIGVNVEVWVLTKEIKVIK